VGRISIKGRFYVWNERVGDGKLMIISITVSVTTVLRVVDPLIGCSGTETVRPVQFSTRVFQNAAF